MSVPPVHKQPSLHRPLSNEQQPWWRGAVCYQIYPRSFLDTTASGTGDLNGITRKMAYLAGLGVEALWISPFLQSPQKDYGYDISDYRSIDPQFGTIDDYRALLDAAHSAGLKIIMDMVLSHTSNLHPWFLESKESRDNPKADWYVWADPKPDGSPPNNWQSLFGGPAWRFHSGRGQYYLHNFLKEQPDLNYHNPDVVREMLDICRYWLDFGVDGFRLDVINFCTHDALLRDNPPRLDTGTSTQIDFPDTYNMQSHIYDKSRPENLDFIRALRSLLDEYPERFSLAEIGDDEALKRSAEYTADESVLHTAYSFEFLGNSMGLPPASYFRKIILAQRAQPGNAWPSWAFSNHDVIRAASRWSGQSYGHNPALSQMAIVLLCSLRGTAFLYQGDELGLPEAEISYDRLQDPWGKYLWPKWQGRDGCRTPMPWDGAAPNAGFSAASEGQTWLPIPPAHPPLSVAAQEQDPASTLNTVREFLHWRAAQAPLKTGEIVFDEDTPEPLLVFQRQLDGQAITCAFNLSGTLRTLPLKGDVIYSTRGVVSDGQNHTLPAYGFVFVTGTG